MRRILIGVSIFVLSSSVVLAEEQENIVSLKEQVHALMNKIERLERQQKTNDARQRENTEKIVKVEEAQKKTEGYVNVARSRPEKDTGGPGIFNGSFRIPETDTSIKVGGRIQADMIVSLSTSSSNTAADYRLDLPDIPLTDSPEKTNEFNYSGRGTRFYADVRNPSKVGELRAYIEADFLGSSGEEVNANSHTLRLRHGYMSWKNGPHFLRVGQSSSAFQDELAAPDTLSPYGPTGWSTVRQPQIFYVYKPAEHLSFFMSLENPETSYIDLKEKGDKLELSHLSRKGGAVRDQLPDVILGSQWQHEYGHIRLRVVGRQHRLKQKEAEGLTGISARKLGYGIGISGTQKLYNDSFLFAHVNFGKGLGRYIENGSIHEAFYDHRDKQLKILNITGITAGLTHYWFKKEDTSLRSTFSYGFTRLKNPKELKAIGRVGDYSDPFHSGNINKIIKSWHANLIWSPIKNFEVGAEYIRGMRRTIDARRGIANRIEVSASYSF